MKPLKIAENEVATKSEMSRDKADEPTKSYSPGDSSALDAAIDISGDSGDEYTDSIFEIAR